MRSLGLALLLGSAAAAAAACSSTTDDSTSAAENVGTGTTDLDLAKKAVDLINGTNEHCTDCHAAGKADIKRWGAAFTAVDAACIEATGLPAANAASWRVVQTNVIRSRIERPGALPSFRRGSQNRGGVAPQSPPT